MADGRVFLETHHVIPLAAGGPDTIANVVALCPNHHREAHHGAKRQEMSDKLLARLSTFGAS
ncbi:HNH endonuclease signature motif containing protein [Polyangium spumosum]